MPTILKQAIRPTTAESRLRALGGRIDRDNPIVPIMLDMLEAARRGVRMDDSGALARLYHTHVVGRIPQEHLQRLHDAVNGLSPEMRARVTARPARASVRLDDGALAEARALLDSRVARLDANHRLGLVSPLQLAAMKPNLASRLDASAVKAGFTRPVLVPLVELEAPVLDAVKPAEPRGYVPGQTLRLSLRYPEWTSPTFKVVLSVLDDTLIDGQSLSKDVATLTPKLLGKPSPHGTHLRVTLPVDLPGKSWLRVVVSAGSQTMATNRVQIKRVVVPATATLLASPELTAIHPGDGQLPGREVLIEGRNIGQVKVLAAGNDALGQPAVSTPTIPRPCYVRLYSQLDPSSELKLPLTVIKPSPLDGVGQARFTLPTGVVPGDYWLQLGVGDGAAIVAPQAFPEGHETMLVGFKVRAHRFAVRLDRIRCLDESDPEALGSDEVVTQIAGVVDDRGWAKGTGAYTFEEDGDVRGYGGTDAHAFPPDGGFGEVRIGLAVETALYEDDAGDVKAWQTTMQAIGELSSAIGELLLKLGDPKGAAIAAAVTAIAGAVSTFAGLFGGSNPLGSERLAWSARDLQLLTDNESRSFSDTMQYFNGDWHGNYEVDFTVSRLE